MRFWDVFRRRKQTDVELDSELRFHIESLVQEKVAQGYEEGEARRRAIVEFGGPEQVKEDLRDVYRIPILEATQSNIKAGLRLIRKAPTLSATIILTLALGIGANSAVFSAIDAVLLRPLPFPHSSELMLLHQYDARGKDPNIFVAPVRLTDWSRFNTLFQAISGWYTSDGSESSGPLPEKMTEAFVAPRFLQVWGVLPEIGRDFSPEEQHFGGPNAVIISHRFWQRRFNADPNALGRRLKIGGSTFSVIGVMPASFQFPDHEVDLWLANPMDAPYAQERSETWFKVIGRLKPGVTVAQAKADLARVQAQLGREFPKTDRDVAVAVEPLKETTVGGARRSLWVLFGAVSLVLLIACNNVAGLLLAHTKERSREIATRYALGGSRGAVVLQLLTECFVLAAIGSLLGLAIAAAGTRMLHNLAKAVPRAEEVTLDWRIVAYTLVCAVVATLISGLAPAIRGTRRGIAGELANGGRAQVSVRNRLQSVLAGTQIALAVTLLIGAGLLIRSFQELGRVSPGFDPSHVLTFRITGSWAETTDYNKLIGRVNRTLEELRATRGVTAASTAGFLPAVSGGLPTGFKIDGANANEDGKKINADNRWVSDGYFETIGIRLLAGKSCRQGASSTAVVNRSFVDTYLSGSPAVGHQIEAVSNPFHIPAARIVGVVADARELGLDQEPVPTVYECFGVPNPFPYYMVRTQGDPAALEQTVRRKVHELEPARSVYEVAPLEELLVDNFAEMRLRTTLLTLFAVTAVSLAFIGLYGTVSYAVSVRRREIGLRLALGAMRDRIVLRFLWKGMSVTAAGCGLGLLIGLALTRVLSGMLYHVSVLDFRAFFWATLLTLAIAAGASLMPAIRAARLQAMDVLRNE